MLPGGHIRGDARHQKSQEESVMKCSNPDCNRGIGLVAYQRGWFSKRRYCSRNCRDAVVVIDDVERSHSEQSPATYFDWLFGQPVLHAQPKLVPAGIRARSEPVQRFPLAK
jgi:hypothetical protein